MNKIKTFSLFFLLLTICRSGPLAPGVWTAVCKSAVQACIASGGLYIPCVIACCGGVGPLLSLLSCFDGSTTVISQRGPISISQVHTGDLLLTKNLQGQKEWTQIEHIVTEEADYEFIRITTQNNYLTVTTDHVMIVNQKLFKAKDLKIGSKIGKETVIKLELIKQPKRIAVITQSGTLLANDFLTTTICGEYIDVHGEELTVLEKWRKDHEWLMGNQCSKPKEENMNAQ